MSDEEEYKAEYLDTAEDDEPEVLHTHTHNRYNVAQLADYDHNGYLGEPTRVQQNDTIGYQLPVRFLYSFKYYSLLPRMGRIHLS